jgi:hypothetical protein
MYVCDQVTGIQRQLPSIVSTMQCCKVLKLVPQHLASLYLSIFNMMETKSLLQTLCGEWRWWGGEACRDQRSGMFIFKILRHISLMQCHRPQRQLRSIEYTTGRYVDTRTSRGQFPHPPLLTTKSFVTVTFIPVITNIMVTMATNCWALTRCMDLFT